MKLHILSDLHLGFASMQIPVSDADVVVLAGDIARPREAAAWARSFDKPVLYVPGNHEFYGSSIDGATQELKQLCAATQVRVLDCDEVVIGRHRFLGASLWTDFELFADPLLRAAAIDEASRSMRDYSRIRRSQDGDDLFTPADSVTLHKQHVRWLQSRLAVAHDGPTVVISHHAPSPQSVHRRFEGSLLNACFASDARHLLGADRVDLWIHGHTHDSFDYRADGTRVVCNPRGYVRAGVVENALFDPQFIVDLPAA